MKKIIQASALSLIFSITLLSGVISQGHYLKEPNGKSLAQDSSGAYCCAANPDNTCTQSPNC